MTETKMEGGRPKKLGPPSQWSKTMQMIGDAVLDIVLYRS
jgi:hypothetical protein